MARIKTEHVVLEVGAEDNFEFVMGKLKDTAACRAWIRAHGEAGKGYQPAAFKGPVLYPEVEQVEKRTLTEQQAPSPKGKPDA